MKNKIYLILLFPFLIYSHSNAQISYPLSSDYCLPFEDILLNNKALHINIKPVKASLNSKIQLIDSIYGKSSDIKIYNSSNFRVRVNPIIQSSYLIKNEIYIHEAVGFQIDAEVRNHFSLFLNYAANIIDNKPFKNTRLDSANLMNHWGKTYKISNTLSFFNQFTGSLNFNANKYLSFQIGNDKHFFGDGYRSLFLSDNSAPYLFFSTTLEFWKIKYVNQVLLLRDYSIGKKYTSTTTKYAAMHMLSWNALKRINISLFEAVIWQSKDSTGAQRSFDLHYLNPFLAFRPVEYNLGSPDNMLIGAATRVQVLKSTYCYSQILFDEFYLKEMLSGSDWWANKYAIQFGLKTYKFIGIKNMFFQSEINITRPFTYGHTYTFQNYGYLLQPLAHPQGANFKEILIRSSYQKNKWTLNLTANLLTYGMEQAGAKSFGSDIYISSNNRIIRNKADNGNYIGQGIPSKEINNEFKIGRILNPRWGLIAEAGITNKLIIKPTRQSDLMFTFGIKTWLYNDQKLF